MALPDSESTGLTGPKTRGISLDELKSMSEDCPGLKRLLDSKNPATEPSPVVLFTGAGASKPLGMPTMLEFKTTFANGLSANKKNLWHKIVASSAKYFKTTSDEIDIEDVLTYVDECEHSYSESSLLWGQFHGDSSGTPTIEQIDEFRELVWSIKSDVLDKLCATYVSPEPSKTIECYAPLFNMLYRSSGQVVTNVFTTNYDLTFEVLAENRPDDFELADGFTTDRSGKEVFRSNYTLQYRSKHSIVLRKLHGSTSWVGRLPDSRFVKAPPGKYVQGDLKTIIIYPTKNKSESQNLSTSPFTQAYGGLASQLSLINTVQVILVIGYGFGDLEIVEEIENGLLPQASAKMIVVDPTASIERMTKVFPNVDASRFRIIPRRFGEKGTIECIEVELQSLLSAP